MAVPLKRWRNCCAVFYNTKKKFTAEFNAYNVHSLLQLHQDCVKFGDLNGVSTFPFENELGILTRKVMGINKVFEQVSTRVGTKNPTQKTHKKPTVKNPAKSGFFGFFKKKSFYGLQNASGSS